VPDDLAPVVILDASGRVRTAYDWWHEHRRTLHRLTPVKKHYDKLTVHVWDIGGGQSSFQREEARYWRTSGIVKTINRRSSDKWLVVCHKAFRKEVEADIRRELKGDPERVSFLHWGIHRASNEFCDVPNIILAGTQFLPTSSYEGIGRAARGILPSEGEITKELQRQIELGELGDRVLQAACRGVVRKALGDKCPPCNVYIIASAGSGLRELLPTIFPGCGIETWEPAPPRLRGKPAKALKFMKEWFADHPGELLSVTLVMEAIDESSRANFNKNIRKHPAFKLNLGKEGICEERSASGRRCIGFTQELEEDDAPTAADFLIDGKEAAKYISALISARQRLIGLVSEHGKLLIELIGARGKPSHPIMPVDLARVADLAPGELVLLECPCGHKAMLSALMLMKRRVKLDRKIADLKQMRCKECGERGGAAVSITRKA
jgi:hypothetical protein